MIDEEQVKFIAKKVLDEEHLLGHIKIFEKEHNLFRGSHDKIQLPAALNIPDTIINQIVEKFETQLTEGSIPFIDENRHFTDLNDKLFYDETKKILCLGLNSPKTDMVGGYIVKEGTPPTQDIADCVHAYAKDTPLERLTDGALETWASATDLTNWTEFKAGGGSVDREASEVHGGTYSCKLTTTAGGDLCGMIQDLILNPGYNCRIAIWYKRTAHGGSNLRLYLYDDGPNVYLQADGTWDSPANPLYLPVAETWTLFELEFVAHANYRNYTIKVYKDHSSGGAVSFYVDDISVSENRNVVPYFRTEAGLTIGLNQDLRTSASVIYAGLTLTGFDGILKAVDGVITKAADHVDLANITSDQHHPQSHALASHSTKAHAELTNITSGQHHAQLHGSTHHSGGGDAIKLDDLASPDDNVDLNASTTKHGLLMKLGGGTENFLRADGTWAAPAGGGDVTAAAVITDHSIVRGDGGAKGIQDSTAIIDDNGWLYIKTAGNWAIVTQDAFNATNNYNSIWKFRRSHSDVLGTQTETVSGDMLGDFWFQGVDTAGNFDRGAGIKATQVGAAGTRIPTNLALETFHSTGKNTGQLILVNDGTVTSTGCITDATCEIMKSRDAVGIIKETLKTGTGNIDKHGHEKWDMKKLYKKYPFLIYEYKGPGDDGNEIITYHDRIGAKGDLAYAAILQLEERIKVLEEQLNN